MDSDDDYEDRMDTRVFMEHGYALGGFEEERERANSSSSSEHGSDIEKPPVLSPPHTMDIPSVRRPPMPVMVPADQVSTHDLPLAETLVVVESELFPIYTTSLLPNPQITSSQTLLLYNTSSFLSTNPTS